MEHEQPRAGVRVEEVEQPRVPLAPPRGSAEQPGSARKRVPEKQTALQRLVSDINTVRANWHRAEQRDMARAILLKIRGSAVVAGYTCPLTRREISPRTAQCVAARLLAHAYADSVIADVLVSSAPADSPLPNNDPGGERSSAEQGSGESAGADETIGAATVLGKEHLPMVGAILIRTVADAEMRMVGVTRKQHHRAWVRRTAARVAKHGRAAGHTIAREIVDILAPLYTCEALAAGGPRQTHHTDAALAIVRAACSVEAPLACSVEAPLACSVEAPLARPTPVVDPDCSCPTRASPRGDCTGALFAIIETVVGRFNSVLPIPPHFVDWINHTVAAAVRHGADPARLAAFIADIDTVTPLPTGHAAYQICNTAASQSCAPLNDATLFVSKKAKKKTSPKRPSPLRRTRHAGPGKASVEQTRPGEASVEQASTRERARPDGKRVLAAGDGVHLGHRHAPP